MEFRFRSDDDRDASLSGRYVVTGGVAMAAERARWKQRIREDLIAREMAQLEAEVRHELEVERELAVRRRVGSVRLVMDAVWPRREATEAVSHAGPTSTTEAQPKAESSPMPEPNEAGTKRKAPAGTIEWRCAICYVSTANMQGLDKHFQGEEHKAKVALLGVDKTEAKNKSSSSSMTEEGDEKPLVKKCVSASWLENSEAKKMKNKEKQNHIWCEVCHIQCNSEMVMASHVRGKKHLARLKSSKKNRIDGASTAHGAAED